MERLSDVLSSVKERVTNPFLVSFAIFWCTYNWRIPIALLFWDMNQIYASGSTTIFEFIQKELAVEGSFSTPLKYAILYSILAPFAFSLISIIGAWAIWVGNTLIFKSSATTPINFDKFMELKKKHKETTDDYAELLTTESETQKQLDLKTKELNQALESHKSIQAEHDKTINLLKSNNIGEVSRISSEASLRIAGLQGDIDALNQQLREKDKEFIESHNPKIIEGVWQDNSDSQEVIIAKGHIQEKGTTFEIVNFNYNKQNQVACFTGQRSVGTSMEYIYYEVRVKDDELRGTRNGIIYFLVRKNIKIISN